jgi:hypothetical protein
MLDLNQRPPPSKFGQSFPGRFGPVGKSRYIGGFLAFLAPPFSCSVLVCTAPVAARLQHLTLLMPVEVDVHTLPHNVCIGLVLPRSSGYHISRVAFSVRQHFGNPNEPTRRISGSASGVAHQWTELVLGTWPRSADRPRTVESRWEADVGAAMPPL